jgi:hypothetical protein
MSTESPKPRSLWSVMPAETTPEAASIGDSAPDAQAEAPPLTAAPKSLWEVMRGATEEESAPADEAAAPDVESAALRLERVTVTTPRSLIQEWWPIVAGGASIPLSAAACWPQLWMMLPGAACGFAAVFWSALVWLEARPSARLRRLALIAGVLGLIGLVAGPAVFAPLGRIVRSASK